MGLGLLFPGQGAQHVAMFDRLLGEPAAAPALDALSQRLPADVRRLAQEPIQPRLAENAVAQLLMVGHAAALWSALAPACPEPAAAAGYSVGELSAYLAAGSLALDDALGLAARRAHCMDAAAADAAQGMIAIRGLARVDAARLAGDTGAAIAIVNGADHFVLGGLQAQVDAIERRASDMGARLVRRLHVQVASHTPLMAGAGPCLARALEASSLRSPRVPVVAGIDASVVRSRERAIATLSAQIHSPLEWARCLAVAVELGATAFLELGPGRGLTRMVQEAFPGIPARAWEDFRSVRGMADWAARWA